MAIGGAVERRAVLSVRSRRIALGLRFRYVRAGRMAGVVVSR